MEEQIDPSFNSINQLGQQTASQIEQQEESFDVAAAAVAVSNDNQEQAVAQQVPAEQKLVSDDSNPLSRNGRALNNTKRAAQNRMAQRAFRQRKEVYIKELEEKAKENDGLKQTIEALKSENMQLRDYSLALQARLIEQPDVPAPPVVFLTRSKDSAKKD